MARKSKDGGSSGSRQTGGKKRQNKAGPAKTGAKKGIKPTAKKAR